MITEKNATELIFPQSKFRYFENRKKFPSFYTENKGTHDVSCAVCGAAIVANVKCNTEDGKCVCGYTEPKCDHMGNHWDYIDNENGLFKGVSSSEFAPMTTMSRAMFVTVLGRLAKVDVEAYTEVAFDDVVADEYYAPYVAWAVENGLAKGYGDGNFGVNDNVTIEQAIVFIARFAQLNGIELDTAEADLSSYADLDEVADWAYNEMLWAVNSGVYTADGVLVPKGAAARAIVADMLYNLCSNFTLGE